MHLSFVATVILSPSRSTHTYQKVYSYFGDAITPELPPSHVQTSAL